MEKFFTRFASATAKATGSPAAFLICVAMVLLWAATGPIFKFSETWQLVINTSTTIITFLMVFLIQNTQNRDSEAVQTKLDELILTSDAENEFVGIEKLSNKELDALHARCRAAAMASHALLARTAEEKRAREEAASERPRAPRRAKARAKPGTRRPSASS